jgi:hypothetical protein
MDIARRVLRAAHEHALNVVKPPLVEKSLFIEL